MKYTNLHDIECEFSKEIRADENGEYFAQNEEALSWFWHLKSSDGSNKRLWTTDVTKPYFCTFTLKLRSNKKHISLNFLNNISQTSYQMFFLFELYFNQKWFDGIQSNYTTKNNV